MPNGKFLLAAHQDTHDIFVFAIDQKTGALTPTGGKIEVPSPVCLVFAKP
ncbi:MAG: beta-propeller fold lactonase family protein [Candidatus Hydrogenedentes bacterium]|nr:beta-propeller fold lactonase family protein [Candidatus Hydrogenedentota bacterium]